MKLPRKIITTCSPRCAPAGLLRPSTRLGLNRLLSLALILIVLGAGKPLQAQAQSDGKGVLVSETVGAGTPAYHASQVLVRFRNGTPAAFLPGSGRANSFPAEPSLHLVQNPPGLSVAETVRRYQANPNVLYAEPDYIVRADAIPNDTLWSQQWDMTKISAPAAWNSQTNATDVVVVIIDTGVDFTHPDLQANLWSDPANSTNHGFTCMNGACTPGGLDDYGHGTHVAGTIGATANNGTGMAGLNWRVQMLACKFLGSNGSGYVSDAVLCFEKALALKQAGTNIRVTSNSWGGGGFSQALKDAMSAAEAAGIVHSSAAGNSGINADVSPMYPAGYDNRGIVSVLASDQNDLGASFTNYGLANVDIAAPGVNTLSTVPAGSCSLCDPSGYKVLSGTSMATPHVSAVLAAMFHLNPALTAYQARDAILDPSSYDLVTDQKGSMTSTGGRLNFLKAISSPLLSAPKLNNFPVVASVSNVFANAGTAINLTAAASDPDNDPLRQVWARGPLNSAPGAGSLWLLGSKLNTTFPNLTGDSLSFQAPALARTAMSPYAVSVSDGRGGGSTALSYVTILPAAATGQAPQGNLTISPTQGPVGTVVSVNFPAVDPEGGPVAWDLWQTGSGGGFGWCCMTGPSFDLPINYAGAFRITVQAIDNELNFSSRQSAVVRIGGVAGTPPIANALFDKLTGAAPLTVNIDMSASTDPDGTIQQYIIECKHGSSGTFDFGPVGRCVYDTPGNYWILLQVKDNDGLMDTLSAYAVVTPPGSPSKTAASVVLGNMSQTYTGSSLTPTATTTPPGLQIAWVNAPQTMAGTYAVTATVNDVNYQGSATGIFKINAVPAPSTPPSVSITNPAGGTVQRGKAVTIQGAATQGTNPIARVDYLINGSVKCSDTSAPYACSWNVPSAPGKTYQLQAKAYDSAGQAGASAIVSVTSSH